MTHLLADLRYGLRVLVKSPGFTAASVLALAVGIGANSAIFSLVDGLFLRPLPVKAPDELVWIYGRAPDRTQTVIPFADYRDFREQNTVFSALVAQSRRGGLVRVGDEIEMALLNVVSDDYFPILGVQALLGRTFRPDLDQRLAAEPAVVISYGLWQRRFGGDPSLVGKTIDLNRGRPCTVVGVLPPSFWGLDRRLAVDVWVPTSTWAAFSSGNRAEVEQRGQGQFEMLGRLRPGVTIEQARTQLETIASRLEQAYPATNKGRGVQVLSEPQKSRGGFNLSMLLLAIVGLVLLIAAVNVANLRMAQAETRRQEFAVRLALGGDRGRLVRQLLAESTLVTLAGAALGLLLAVWLIASVPALMPAGQIPFRFDLRLDGRVLTFTLGLCIFTTLLFGLAPAFRASRPDLTPILKGVQAGLSGSRRFSLRSALVVGQIALSVVLVAASALLVRSFLYTLRLHPGFDPHKNLLVMQLVAFRPVAFEDLLDRLRALPGVRQGSYARRIHLSGSGGGATRDVTIPGIEPPPGQESFRIKFNQVGLGYFQTVGTRILEGRDFDYRDTPGSTRVVLVSQAMGHRFWPGESAVGKWVRTGGTFDRQVVGVVEDAKVNGIHELPEPYLYFPFAQMPSGELTLLIETAADPGGILEAAKREVRAADPSLTIFTTTTLRQHMRSALYFDWLPTVLVSSLSALGMLLAAVGVYGVMSYAVNRRRHEIGVRMAMGAGAADVLRLILAHALKLALVGAVMGLAAALAASRILTGMLHGVRPADPLAHAASLLVVIAAALLAAFLPARRATQADPAAVLRHE